MITAAALEIMELPAFLTMKELREQEEPNAFTVALEAGKEYTVQFSKNLAELLLSVVPRIKIYDPENAELPELEAEGISTDVKAFPPEHPSVILHTFKPEVSGNYLVRISDSEPSTYKNTSADLWWRDTSSMIFVFEEKRDADGNPGHHRRYRFADVDGKRTDPIGIEDLIQLRKELWNIDNDSYNDIVRPQPRPNPLTASGFDDKETVYAAALNVFKSATDDQTEKYSSYLDIVQNRLGLVAVDSDEDVEYGDTYGEAYFGADPVYTTNKKLAANDFPYSETPGFSEALQPSEAKYKKKAVPVKTKYSAEFVSTRMEAESKTTTNGSLSMAKNSLGASVSMESTSNMKFGLTSTNLIIHYEELEANYRQFTDTTYENMLYQPYRQRRPKNPTNSEDTYPEEFELVIEEASVSSAAASDKTVMDWIEGMSAHVFRNQFGDYFVAGYQFGAFFDAYISITTKTTDQLEKTKKTLQATMNNADTKASADISREVSNTLKECDARVNITIVTNGMGKKPIQINVTSGDSDVMAMATGINTVFTELMSFRNRLAKEANPDEYAPVRVKLKRWRSIFDIAMVHLSQVGTGKTDDKVAEGYIPVPVSKAVEIGSFNSAFGAALGHYNDTGTIDTNSTKLQKARDEFSALKNKVINGGNYFYTSGGQIAPALKELKRIDDILISFSDRYAFFNKLRAAQAHEKEVYDGIIKDLDGKDPDGIIYKAPFGGPGGGSSGYDAFDVSEYVTKDIKAGKKVSRTYDRDAKTCHWVWHQDHASGQDDYLSSAGPAKLAATTGNSSDRARLCKIWVSAPNDKDTRREIANSPAVGKLEARFELRIFSHDEEHKTFGAVPYCGGVDVRRLRWRKLQQQRSGQSGRQSGAGTAGAGGDQRGSAQSHQQPARDRAGRCTGGVQLRASNRLVRRREITEQVLRRSISSST